MSEIEDGGPAYPGIIRTVTGIDSEGFERVENERYGSISLRDFLARLAMHAAANNPEGANGFTFNQRVEWAYQQADAMIKARKFNS